MEKQATCEERVKENLQGRLDDLRLLYAGEIEDWDTSDREIGEGLGIDIDAYFDGTELLSQDDLEEAVYTARNEYGLCFDYVAPETFKNDQEEGYFRYQLSTGGPGDEFRFFVNPDLSCHRIEYWFLDWYDGASRRLHLDDKKLLLQVWEDFKETGTAQARMEEATV